MSLGWKIEGTIYSNFQEGVQKQLDDRKTIVQKTTGRTDQDLLFLTSNTSWARLSSGIISENKDDNYEPSDFILFGGTQSKTTGNKSGLNFEGKNSSYNYSEQYGYRPMAGLNNIEVKTHGTFGAVKKAVVNFKVNSLKELETFEKLYMLPGYSMLLEWGHSLILANKKVETLIQYYKKWFRDKPPHDNDEAIHRTNNLLKRLEELRKKQNYNYDAIFGRVSNYTWAFSDDGTYDCSIDIVGYGEVAESISSVFSLKPSEDEKEYISETKLSRFNGQLDLIQTTYPTPLSYVKVATLNEMLTEGQFSFGGQQLVSTIKKTYNEVLTVQLDNSKEGAANKNSSYKFITFGSLLNSINQNFMLGDDGFKWVKFYCGEYDTEKKKNFYLRDPYEGNDSYLNKTPFTTFTDHISTNLDVCILPKPGNLLSLFKIDIASSDSVNSMIIGEHDDILNILLNVQMISDLYHELIAQTNIEDTGIYTLIEKILSKINKSCGEINNFSIEERDQVKFICDRKGTPGKKEIDYTLDLFGLKSLTRSLNVQSLIPPSLSNMIAIGAAGGGSSLSEEIFNFERFYEGYIDGYIPQRTQDPLLKATGLSGKMLDKQRQAALEGKQDAKNIFNASVLIQTYVNTINTKNIDPDFDPADMIASHKVLTHLKLKQELIKKGLNPPGIIPIQLSFDILGISGLRITDVFNLAPGILPSRYKDVVSFTITGITNRVESNSWITSIDSQMIITDVYKTTEKYDLSVIENVLLETKEIASDPNAASRILFPNAFLVRDAITSTFSPFFTEKGFELTSSGKDILQKTAQFALALMRQIDTINKTEGFRGAPILGSTKFRWTGGNDKFHIDNPSPPKSTSHRIGQGLDLAIQVDATPSEITAATKVVTKAFNRVRSRFSGASLKDEYKEASGHATGGHWHFTVK